MSITTRSMRSANAAGTAEAAAVTKEDLMEETEEGEDVGEPGPPLMRRTTQTSKVYALTPALISNEAIDYGTSAGVKIYK